VLLKDLSEELHLNIEGNKYPKLNDIILAVEKNNSNEAKELSKIHSAMKEIVNKIDSAMKRNKILIDHSRNFIKETISALANPSHPILDRKV
jgi:ATP-dependent helicase/DNAse subunit B